MPTIFVSIALLLAVICVEIYAGDLDQDDSSVESSTPSCEVNDCEVNADVDKEASEGSKSDALTKLKSQPISLVNDISFTDPQFDKKNTGNAFLVSVDERVYGITAKHILMLAKTDRMKFVDLNDELREWRMHPKDDSEQYLTVGTLLNSDKSEPLSWENDFDWLVFDITKNNSDIVPLTFRSKEVLPGELLYVVGWSYADKDAQPIYQFKYIETSDNYITTEQIKGPESLAGLSGAPLIDKDGLLVGLVSSGGEDETTGKVNLYAAEGLPLLNFIRSL